MKNKAKNWWLMLLKGIILIILSFVVFQHPVGSLVGLATFIGIAWLLTGITIIAAAFMVRGVDENWGNRLAEGIIDTLLAIFLLSNPEATTMALPFIVGFWIIVSGVTTFGASFKAKKEGDSNWWLSLLGGILTVLIGWFIMTDFFAGAVAITMWIGIGLLILGIVNIALSLRLKKLNAAIS